MHLLLLQLPFTGLTEVVHFPLHIFDVGDLVVALLCFLRLGIGTQRWSIQLLVQVIDLI
jgi:hypothetical protein